MLVLKKNRAVDTDGKFSLYTRYLYKSFYLGNPYDPNDDNYKSNVPLTEFMQLVSKDENFGFYINTPIYKIELIGKDDYLVNHNTGDVFFDPQHGGKIHYMYICHDNDLVPLDIPLKDPDDGYITIHHGLLEGMVK